MEDRSLDRSWLALTKCSTKGGVVGANGGNLVQILKEGSDNNVIVAEITSLLSVI